MNVRRRGEGSVYRRGRIFWVKYSVRGRAYRESAGSENERDAVRLLRRRLSEIAAGLYTPDAHRLAFNDLQRFVEEDYRLNSRRSLTRVRAAFEHLRTHFDDARAVDITTGSLASYVQVRMDRGAAAATIAYELAALKRGFALAMRIGHPLRRPHFPTIRLDNARSGFFEEPEYRALLSELPDYLKAPVGFAYLTGWRITSEVLSLQWNQVDLSTGVVRLEPGTTKNREGREWPLHSLPELRALLEWQRALTDDAERQTGAIVPFVFHRKGQPIRSIRAAWGGACQRAGLEGRIPHDFRRTAVRNLERAGVPRAVAMRLVGHKTESVYRRCAIVAQRDLAEGVAKLAQLRALDTRRSHGREGCSILCVPLSCCASRAHDVLCPKCARTFDPGESSFSLPGPTSRPGLLYPAREFS